MYKIFLLVLLPIFTMAQTSVVGKIVNSENQPITNAKVILVEQNITLVSDSNGEFSSVQGGENVKIIVVASDYQTIEQFQSFKENFIIQLEKNKTENAIETITVIKKQNTLGRKQKAVTNTQNLSQGELQKAACCNLSESFETNPSIDVNFSDAVTGNKQIKMLGLTSPYILMSEENIPAIRGALQATGLNFIPGTWAESIQITKGAGSVVNGYESISGQINY
jgi:outer membrane receptor for ferrienterochelin and colicins